MLTRRRPVGRTSGPILHATGLTKRYGGLVANSDIDFVVNHGEIRGIIGPNGAGKSTFFKMLTCETAPTSGRIVFEGRDITRMSVTDVCQLGLTKSYQINQLFDRLTVRQNLQGRGAGPDPRQVQARSVPQSAERSRPRRTGRADAGACQSDRAAGHAECPSSPTAKSAGLRSGLRWRPSPSLLLLDEPLAGMSPRERVETVALIKSIARGRTMIIIDHDMDSLFELVERVTVLQEGRVLVEGTPNEIKINPKVQEAYLGGVSRRGRVSLHRSQGAEQLLRRFATSSSTSAARREKRGRRADRAQRRGQDARR